MKPPYRRSARPATPPSYCRFQRRVLGPASLAGSPMALLDGPRSRPAPPTSAPSRQGKSRGSGGGLAQREGARLVTLTGPGGVGKTSLGLAVVDKAGTALPRRGGFRGPVLPVGAGPGGRGYSWRPGIVRAGHQPLLAALVDHLSDRRSCYSSTTSSKRYRRQSWWPSSVPGALNYRCW